MKIRPPGIDQAGAQGSAGEYARMGEDTHNHRGLCNDGDDLQGAPALWAVFDIDIEDVFE